MDSSLPFERGETYYDGNIPVGGDQYGSARHLLGRTFSVQNDGQADVGNDASETELMVVRNGSGGDIPINVAVKYGDSPYNATGLTAADGDFGHVIDDAYRSPIKANDLFYVLVRGPVKITMGTGVAMLDGEPLGFGPDGKVVNGASITAHVAGACHGDQPETGDNILKVLAAGHPFAIGPIG